jgi:hypothetical protein
LDVHGRNSGRLRRRVKPNSKCGLKAGHVQDLAVRAR